MPFLDELDVRVLVKPREFVLLADFRYQAVNGKVYTVPARFHTDFASIPVPFRNIFDVNGPSRMPAVLHDALYSLQPLGVTREMADDLFYEALISVGVNSLVAGLYWCGVRAGGWLYWRRRESDPSIEDFVPE